MLFYCYVTVAAHPFWRLFTALFVRKFTFATRFCDALIVYFRLFLNSKPFFHVSLHFVCTFRRCFFFLWLSLHCIRSFAAPSATKNSADGSSEPICAVPPYSLILQLFALTEPGVTQSATSPAKKDIAQRIAEQSKKAGPLAKPCLLLFCPPSFMRHLSI